MNFFDNRELSKGTTLLVLLFDLEKRRRIIRIDAYIWGVRRYIIGVLLPWMAEWFVIGLPDLEEDEGLELIVSLLCPVRMGNNAVSRGVIQFYDEILHLLPSQPRIYCVFPIGLTPALVLLITSSYLRNSFIIGHISLVHEVLESSLSVQIGPCRYQGTFLDSGLVW